ncbi:MAG: DNA polymerase III subunit delta' [Burkholderiaceae bacterium]|nr:DNA polymerase III subunit delta' [Burkholderiaceae bacterium]
MIYPWLEEVWRGLLEQHDRPHHALLVHGPSGIGKSDLADELQRAWLCESPASDGSACGRCAACGWIAQGNHPDLRVLSPAAPEEPGEDAEGAPRRGRASAPSKDIRVEQVRALERFICVGGHRGGCKVVRVEPADALNVVSANALLKTLEEPGAGTRFLLVTHRPDAMPATIRSRCLAVALAAPANEIAIDWLVAETGTGRAQASRWLAAAGGAPLRARAFADPATASAHRLLVETFASLPETPVLRAADALAGVEPSLWVGVLQSWIADLQRCRAGAAPRFFPDRAERLQALSQATSLQALDRLGSGIATLARAVDHPLNARLMLEDALIRLRAAWAG